MLLNSISAIGKYRPSIPQNCTITTMSSTSYNAGYGGSVKVTSTGSTDPGRGTIDYYGTVILDSGYNQVASANLSASQLSAGYTFTGLDITKTYFASIASHNEVGFCASNANTNTVTVHSAPQGISTVSASVASTTSVNLSWSAWSNTSSNPYADYASTPSNGNLAITGYKVEIYDPYGANPAYPVSTVTFDSTHTTGGTITYAFTKAHPYFFFLSAINADGLGYGKSSNLVTPNP